MRGLLLHEDRASALVDDLHELGLLAAPAGPDVLRFVPPLTVTDGEIDEGLLMVGRAIGRRERAHA